MRVRREPEGRRRPDGETFGALMSGRGVIPRSVFLVILDPPKNQHRRREVVREGRRGSRKSRFDVVDVVLARFYQYDPSSAASLRAGQVQLLASTSPAPRASPAAHAGRALVSGRPPRVGLGWVSRARDPRRVGRARVPRAGVRAEAGGWGGVGRVRHRARGGEVLRLRPPRRDGRAGDGDDARRRRGLVRARA